MVPTYIRFTGLNYTYVLFYIKCIHLEQSVLFLCKLLIVNYF